MYPHIQRKHFKDYQYSRHVQVPKLAYHDIHRSEDPQALSRALTAEYRDHRRGRSGAGLFHTVDSTSKALVHWGKK